MDLATGYATISWQAVLFEVCFSALQAIQYSARFFVEERSGAKLSKVARNSNESAYQDFH